MDPPRNLGFQASVHPRNRSFHFPMRTLHRSIVVASLILASASAQVWAQSTWHVDLNGPNPPGTGTPADPYTSLQFAISRPTTGTGDIVVVHPGTYFERIDFLGKGLTIGSSNGQAVTILDGAGLGSVVSAKSGEPAGTMLNGFTIQHGSGTFDAALNRSEGGGVFCVGSELRIENCTLIDNRTLLPGTAIVKGAGGGVFADSATVQLITCVLDSNQASQGGGAWFESSTGTFFFSAIVNNVARASTVSPIQAGHGGGVGCLNSSFNFDSGPIASNVAESLQFQPARGGGLLLWGGSGMVLNAQITDNAAGAPSTGDFQGQGGGIEAMFQSAPTNLFIGDLEIAANRATQGAGAFGTATFSNVRVHDNVGQIGAGIYSFGSIVHGCDVFDNQVLDPSAPTFGLGIFNEPTTLTRVSFTKIRGHSAMGRGTGLNGGECTNCQIFENLAVGAFASQGAGACDANLIGCIVHDNRALQTAAASPSAAGGGMFGGTANRCMVYDNQANSGGGARSTALDHCTFDNNSIQGSLLLGGGLSGGSAVNSILWNNHPDDASGASVSWSDVGTFAPGVGNIAVNPQFWFEQFHDYYLRTNSPCIDAGDPASPNDPNGSRADMGAIPFEVSHYAPPVRYCTAKVNSLGCTPMIGCLGAPSLALGNLRVLASSVLNNKPGILLWSSKATSSPFQGGLLCVRPPLTRTLVQASGGSSSGNDCSGSYAFQWSHAYSAAHGITLGQRVFAQYWSRDPQALGGSGLTDGLDFTFIP